MSARQTLTIFKQYWIYLPAKHKQGKGSGDCMPSAESQSTDVELYDQFVYTPGKKICQKYWVMKIHAFLEHCIFFENLGVASSLYEIRVTVAP